MMQDVERVARTLAPHLEGGREFDQMPPDRRTLKIWRANGMCGTNDATQEDAIDAATAALSAMTPDAYAIDWIDVATALHAGEDVGYARGWNDGIEAAKWAVVGYIHPDHGRLPGEAFASAQIDKLKKPTGNLAPTTTDSV
jgi:hypothetical protein